MQKTQAIEILGGSISAAAKAIGVSYQAVRKWPEVLPPRIADRVDAASARLNIKPRLRKSIANSQKNKVILSTVLEGNT